MAVDRFPAGRDLLAGLTVVAAAAVALLIGVAVGNQDPGLLLLLGLVTGVGLLVAATFRPVLSFRILLTTLVTLPVFPVTESRGSNPADLLLFPALAGAWLLVAAPDDTAIPAPVTRARTWLRVGTWLYLGACVLSLVVLAFRGHADWAADSLLLLSRFVQGLLYFPLALRLLRTREDLYRARDAIVAGFLVGALVNVIGLLFLAVPRAGFTWNVKVGDYFISSPNELGFAMTFLWALLLAMPFRNRLVQALLLLGSLALLVASGSRSGLLSWLTFVLIWAALHRKGWILMIPLLLAGVLPLLPDAVFGRFTRTVLAQKGSFEVYSTLVRVYAWKTAVTTFQNNPIVGVGYLCFRFFSHQYNALTLNLGTAENVALEVAAGTGIVGLAAAACLATAILRLAAVVRRVAARNTPAWRLGRIAIPLFPACLVANLTGDNLMGMVSAAQIAVFCAMLIAAMRLPGPGHDAAA